MDDAHPGRITHMKQDSLATQALQQITWSWPLDLEQYDKDPQIYPLEYAELEKRFQNGKNGHIYPHTKQILHRFVDPIADDVARNVQTTQNLLGLVDRGMGRKYLPERSTVLSPIWALGDENARPPLPSCARLLAQSASPNGTDH